MAGFPHPITPSYLAPHGRFQPVAPAPSNGLGIRFASPQGEFKVARLPQSDLHTAMVLDPTDEGHMRDIYDKPLGQILAPIWLSVGSITGQRGQVSTCTLVSANLALVPSHSIEGFDVRELRVTFGYAALKGVIQPGKSYPVQHVIECDPLLDYALIQLDGTPGLEWGFAPIHPETDLNPEASAALLHHPLNQPLKVSIHSTSMSTHDGLHRLTTLHDSDYGSSGGAYIGASGKFFAMHLGMERTVDTLTTLRVALPIQEIFRRNPNSMLTRFANRQLNPRIPYNFRNNITYYLPPLAHSFFDFEKFEHSRLNGDKSYTLRTPDPINNLPGVIIDSHQAKHSCGWPGGNSGGKGSRFPFGLDDTILLAEALLKQVPTLNNPSPTNPSPSLIPVPIDKKALGNELYKQLKSFNEIVVYAGFLKPTNSWAIHFFLR